jgi:plasmid maintenance system antidote protein VapI
MSATVKTAKKLLLGREIAHMIDTADSTQTEAAKIIETSQSRIASLIGGGSNIAPGDLEMLAKGLGFTDPGYLQALRDLRRDNHKRGFWTTGHNRAYSEEIRLRIDLERHADEIRGVEVEVVPGLLQTERYARAQHAEESNQSGVTLDDRIAARLARQTIMDKTDPPLIHYVMSESCVRRTWGEDDDDDIMREQIKHMITLSQRPNVRLQVLPFRPPPRRSKEKQNKKGISAPFTLLRVPTTGAAGSLQMAYVEGESEIRYLDDRKALRTHEEAWGRLTNAALKFEETRDFLRDVARDFSG